MKRREFLKSTLLFAAVSTVIGKATGLLDNVAYAAKGAFPMEKKHLGYLNASPHKDKGKLCGTCKYYKEAKEAGVAAGECTLPAMKNVVKKANPGATTAYVKFDGYCNMWQKKPA